MKKKSNRPAFENSPEALEEISIRINNFMMHQLEKTSILELGLLLVTMMAKRKIKQKF